MVRASVHAFRFVEPFGRERAGGVAFLKSLASPFQDLRFCPTGGVSAKNAADYLSLPNVIFAILVIGVVGMALDALFARLQRAVTYAE